MDGSTQMVRDILRDSIVKEVIVNDPRRPNAVNLQVEGKDTAVREASLRSRFVQTCARSLNIASPLTEEDCCVQSMPDASPVKWHLAHTTWFFETFILDAAKPGRKPFHPAFRVLFNSYYHAVGDRHPRPQRGMLSRPTLQEVLDYRSAI